MLQLPVATPRCRQIPAIVIQHSQYFADLHITSISRARVHRRVRRRCSHDSIAARYAFGFAHSSVGMRRLPPRKATDLACRCEGDEARPVLRSRKAQTARVAKALGPDLRVQHRPQASTASLPWLQSDSSGSVPCSVLHTRSQDTSQETKPDTGLRRQVRVSRQAK